MGWRSGPSSTAAESLWDDATRVRLAIEEDCMSAGVSATVGPDGVDTGLPETDTLSAMDEGGAAAPRSELDSRGFSQSASIEICGMLGHSKL